MKKTILFSVLAMLCLFFRATAQSKSTSNPQMITGKVTDEQGLPLPGATVQLLQTKVVAVTGKDGDFQVAGVNVNGTLLVSFIGYNSLQYPFKLSDGQQLLIQLKPSANALDEVQVIAYGKTTKRYNTGNVTSVTAADIEKQPVSNVLAALEGRVPGMVISQTSGVPGSSFSVQIRGQSALDPSLSKNDPLFVIDGVPFESGNAATNQINSAANNPTSISSGGLSPLNTINPADIESIEVLKDADATAIYGSRAANGVILITTKKGKAGDTKVNVSVNSGISKIGRSVNLLNTQQYVAMRKEAFANDGVTISNNSGDPGFAPDITLWDTNRYTDLKKLLIGNTAHATDAQVSVSGGNVSTQFLIGGGYHRETTVYPGDFADAIASLHFNINHTSTDKRFNLLFSGMYANDNNQLPRYDLTRYINLPPNIKLYDSSGKLAWQDAGILYSSLGNNDIINPLSLLQEKYRSINANLLGNLQLSYKILPSLVLRSSLGYNTFRSDESTTRPSAAIDPNSGELPSSGFASSNTRNWIIEPQLEYTRVTTNDKLSVLLGNTYQDKSGSTSALYGSNYNSDLLLNSIAAAPVITASNDLMQYRYTAFFGRINYQLHDKYILNISGRRDGSSRFAPENRWANFGAVGVAWIFSAEPVVKMIFPFLSFGKLRGSYGRTGNDQIGDYKFLNLWSNTVNTYNGLSGLYPKALYNPDYSWEINKKLEAALELGFLNDDILFSAAYYNNRSSNQLISYSLPTQTGFFNVVRNFPGLVSNTGWELTLTTRNIHQKDFTWTTAFNITIPQNKLLAFPGLSTSSYASRYVIGQSLNLINALKYTGVDPKTGVYTFEDKNKDGQLTTDDYQVQGNLDPKFYGGLQNNLTYKQFDLSFFFEFRKQTGLSYLKQLAFTPPGWIYNQPDLVLNRWQQPSDVKPVQQYTSGYTNAYIAIAQLTNSNGIYTDASFIRLKNVALAYRLPANWLSRYHISNCRIYLQAQNLLTITNYKGADPETQNFYILPPLRSIVGGIQFNF
jgi:TonB-linked SusC/RagA family outer membrane protein